MSWKKEPSLQVEALFVFKTLMVFVFLEERPRNSNIVLLASISNYYYINADLTDVNPASEILVDEIRGEYYVNYSLTIEEVIEDIV